MVVEMYTRLMTGAVNKSYEEGADGVSGGEAEGECAYAGLTRGVLAKA